MIAADAREFSGLAPRLEGAARLRLGVDYAVAGEWNGRRLVLAANGAGPALARRAVAAVAAAGEPISRLVSTGYCGALDPALRPADVVVCKRVLDAATGERYDTADEFGAVCWSGDQVVATAREKQELRQATGASVVEMEAAGVAAEARARGVAFHCIRAVTDTADEDFAIDLNAARDRDGRFSTARVVAAALRRPRTGIPELKKLNDRAGLAARALGDYLTRHAF